MPDQWLTHTLAGLSEHAQRCGKGQELYTTSRNPAKRYIAAVSLSAAAAMHALLLDPSVPTADEVLKVVATTSLKLTG